MTNLVLVCDHCGHRMRVPEFAMGSRGRCAACGAVLVVNESNTSPLREPESNKPAAASEQNLSPLAPSEKVGSFVDPSANAPVRPKDSTCARCGKPFRGNWDRNPTPQGTLCHICSRLVTESPTPVVSGKVAVEPPADPTSYFPAEPLGHPERDTEKPVPGFARNHPHLFRGIIATTGAIVVLLAFYFALFGEHAPASAPPSANVGNQTPTVEITRSFAVFVWVTCGIFIFLGNFFALYVASALFDRLRGDSFVEVLLHLLFPTFIVAGLGFLPCVGSIFAAIILYAWFDFEFRVIAAFFLLHAAISFVAWQCALFVVGTVVQMIG